MSDLSKDSIVTGGDGRWTAEVSPDWQIWGTNGGYLAVMALRAACLHTGLPRPASLDCHFLGQAVPGPVELTTDSLRLGKRAQSVRVHMTQNGHSVLEALVWTAADGLAGLPLREAARPADEGPHSLASVSELLPGWQRDGSFWDLIEERPVRPEDYVDWPAQPWAEPLLRTWIRFRSPLRQADLPVDFGRALIAIDVFPFIAGARVLPAEEITHMAPTVSLSVSFHHPAPDADWLLVHTESPFSGDGLLSGRASIWAETGELIATGTSLMLCRPWK